MKKLLLLSLLGLASTAFAIPTNLDAAKGTTPLGSGVGLGVMYGKVGANLEYRTTGQTAITAGVGLDGNGGWFAGARYYLKPEGRGPRGRVTAGVGLLDAGDSDEHTGAALAIGWSWANANNDFQGVNFDITTRGEISVGYQF